MARFASTIEIAGVVFTGCKGLLIDGQQFADSERGSVDFAFDATPHPQVINAEFKGSAFGISLGSDGGANLISKVNETIYAVRVSTRTQGWFPIIWVDEQYSLDLECVQDFNQSWYTYGPYSEGYLQSVIFRFIVLEANSVALSTEE